MPQMYTLKFYYLRRVACYVQSVENDLYIVKFQSQKFLLTLFTSILPKTFHSTPLKRKLNQRWLTGGPCPYFSTTPSTASISPLR